MTKITLYIYTLLLFVACSKSTPQDRFSAAIIDASRELISDDIYDGLVSLKYGDSPLVEWKIMNSDTLLLVATLQSRDWRYSNLKRGERFVTDSLTDGAIWVTIPEELNEKLLSEDAIKDSLALNNRLLEIIGLRPDGNESRINLLWINKNSLLRPSYNPDTSTTYGAIEYPENKALPSWYIEWFESNIAYSYESPTEGLNYPFTRLGYTYDWGNGASKYGLSEFITSPSSIVTIENSIDCWTYYKNL